MGRFGKDTKARAWMLTFHIANMEQTGLSEAEYMQPETLARFLVQAWCDSGKARTAGAVVCMSKNNVYHAHAALYGNLTTLGNVSKTMYYSHVEPQLGGKKELKSYLLKEPPYDESGEKVLYAYGLENVQERKGKRSDLDEIENLIEQGMTPVEIMETHFSYRRYEKMIKSAYIEKRIRETALIKDMHNEYHIGDAGSGKTYYYYQLCEKYKPENVYLATDFENGGFDYYIEQGAPPILFLDEFKGNIKYGQLLVILDKYSRAQTHSRYANTYNLWTTCIITSVYPPEEVYSYMVNDGKRSVDKIDQLLRRLDVIVYHYCENGEYKTFSIPANEYRGYADLRRRARADKDGFEACTNLQEIPFEKGAV